MHATYEGQRCHTLPVLYHRKLCTAADAHYCCYNNWRCYHEQEAHTYKDIETTPPVPVSEVGRNAALVVAEMLKLRDAFADVQNMRLQVRRL
jgi:hypothetical protein